MSILRLFFLFPFFFFSLNGYSQVEAYTIDLHGKKEKVVTDSIITIPLDSLENEIIESLSEMTWEQTYEGLIINDIAKRMLTAKAYMICDTSLLYSKVLRGDKITPEYNNCISFAHDKIYKKFIRYLKVPDKRLLLIHTVLILQSDSLRVNDSIYISDDNRWNIKGPTVLTNPYKRD